MLRPDKVVISMIRSSRQIADLTNSPVMAANVRTRFSKKIKIFLNRI